MEKDIVGNNTRIQFANKSQVDTLTQFQLNMAMETENLQLDKQLVHDALVYLLDSSSSKQNKNELGILLVKLREQKLIGTLLVTLQSQVHWWIQSVYVISEERRKGHFTSLFQEAVRIGKERNAKSICLYVETQNARAKATYEKLGMHQLPLKMYSYDFVYGNFSLENKTSQFSAQKIVNGKQSLSNFVENQINILTGCKYQESAWNHVYAIKKGDKICGVSKVFPEFSDWRFGVMWYFKEMYIIEEEKQNYQDMMYANMKSIIKESDLKVAAIRALYTDNENLKFEEGHLEHYYIMEINL